jgi:hypothetical protein
MKMQTSRIHVPFEDFKQIEQAIKNSGVKFYPFQRKRDGYNIEFESQDSPLLVYLILKYDVVRVQND